MGSYPHTVMLSDRCSPEKKDFARKLRRNQTGPEKLLWGAIRRKTLGVQVKRQRIIRGYIVDFYIPAWRLAIEIDGPIHLGREEQDARRDAAILRGTGIRVIRFKNEDVTSDLPAVVLAISQHKIG